MKINKILESANVTRFHSAPGIQPQTIAQHSWGVAMLCQHFSPGCRKEVIMAALTHDCAELVTGDTPATSKWLSVELKELLREMEMKVERDWGIAYDLTDGEKNLLKICDVFEGMEYCIDRYRHGELEAKEIFHRWRDYILKNFKLEGEASDYFFGLELRMKYVKE